MLINLSIQQLLCLREECGDVEIVAQSSGIHEDRLAEARRMCADFGARPVGIACPLCIIAQPLGKRDVAVARVADQPGGLVFHFLILGRDLYRAVGGDPFLLADRLPACWQARGDLPELCWPNESPPVRTVQQVQRVLQRPDGPNLLGGAQVLVDGGRLVFERSAADTALLRDLWLLLPTSTRCDLWPASFAFANALRFHAVVLPRVEGDTLSWYVTEEQAGDYPQGRYELNLQIAAEAGDQTELDALFARRSRAETWRLGLFLLVLSLLVLLVMNWLNGVPVPVGR